MANKKIEGLETEFAQFRTEINTRFAEINDKFAAMQQENKAMQEANTKRLDDVMKALEALTTGTSKIQTENEKKNTGPQYDDLGFLMNHRNLNETFDPKKKVEGVVFRDKNSSVFEVGSGSNGIENHYTGGSKRGSFGADFRFRKLKMPIFEGEDAHGWIYRMERYFDIQEIQEMDQLWAAVLCMEGPALSWYRWSEGRALFRSWEGLKRRLLERFQQSYEGTLCEQFLGITQDGTAREYVALFERLAGQLVGIPEPVLQGTFINGLKPELRASVRVMQPEGLDHAMKLSISIDENKTSYNVLWGGGSHRSTIEQTTSKGENFRRLTDSELQAKKAKGLCYRCDKKFAPGHRCPSQTLQVMLVDESDGSDEEAAPDLQVKRWDPGTKID